MAPLGSCHGGPPAWLQLLPGVPAQRFGVHLAAATLYILGAVFGSLVVATGVLEPVAATLRATALPLLEVPAIILLMVARRWAGVSPAISVLLLGPVLVKGDDPATAGLRVLPGPGGRTGLHRFTAQHSDALHCRRFRPFSPGYLSTPPGGLRSPGPGHRHRLHCAAAAAAPLAVRR